MSGVNELEGMPRGNPATESTLHRGGVLGERAGGNAPEETLQRKVRYTGVMSGVNELEGMPPRKPCNGKYVTQG